MGYLYNSVETTGVPIKMINEIIRGFEVNHFVETGTAGAESIVIASNHFSNCYTIELIEGRTPTHREELLVDKDDPTIVEHIFVKIEYPKNIFFYVGDSTELLPKINTIIGGEYAIYWLDAHYSDPEPSPEDCVECPIVSEIESISNNQKAIIVIDDARLFLGTPPPPLKANKWIDIHSLFVSLHNNFNSHHITIIDDYVVAIPKEMKDNLNSYWLETYNKRFK